jgi:hypothetical protein
MVSTLLHALLCTLTLAAAATAKASHPPALAGPAAYLETTHLTTLHTVVSDALDLEDAVIALLEKYTLGAERVVRSAHKLQQQQALAPSCKLRVLKHLNNRLNLQQDQSSSAVGTIEASMSSSSPTAMVVQHMKAFAATISSHAEEIDSCLDRCDADTLTLFGKSSSGGGIGAGPGAPGAGVDCPLESKKLRQDMKKTTDRIRRSIERTAAKLTGTNMDIGSTLSGGDLAQDRKDSVKRGNDLSEYLHVKQQHEDLSNELSAVLKSRAEVLAGAALARATTAKAIATLRTTCDMVKAKRVALLNATNQTSMKFLHTLHDQLQVYEDVVHEARGKNDIEEKYAMSLAAKVDEAAAKCMASMESITSRIVTQKKAERRPIGDDVLAVGSIMNGKATKADGVDAKDVNEQGAAWAQQVYSTERQRALDHGPKAHEVPLLLVEVAKSDSDDAQEVEELKKQALLIDQKLEKAERAGKVGDKLPADLVGNAEATSETVRRG